MLALRLSPRDTWTIEPAQLALAMASYTAREYDEAVRWAQLAIQSQPAAPIRRAIMVACCARAGDLQRAAQERASLDGFAPISSPACSAARTRCSKSRKTWSICWTACAGGRRGAVTASRRLAAILAADVAGYSRLMGEDEEGTLGRLKAIRTADGRAPSRVGLGRPGCKAAWCRGFHATALKR